MNLYKVLREDGQCYSGGRGTWSLPVKDADGTWTPGEWMPAIEGKLAPCRNGYHLCREQDLLTWLGPVIYEAEYRGEIVETDDKVVVRETRLLRRCEGWNERTVRLFACDCAERALHIFEAYFPDDKRPRNAIERARRYANGTATDDELAAAWNDELPAAWNAAWDAASAAAWAARAARPAANAAWAANNAARAAAWAARAARPTASIAAWDARAAEMRWQVERLAELLAL